jgi:hypothetical protein
MADRWSDAWREERREQIAAALVRQRAKADTRPPAPLSEAGSPDVPALGRDRQPRGNPEPLTLSRRILRHWRWVGDDVRSITFA